MLKYTLCLIRNGDQFLLLNRIKKPQMGTWNGVGGKIESGETPLESVIRETFEETGIQLKEIVYAGNAVFQSKKGCDGMYLFIAELPAGGYRRTPFATAEGILDWKPVDWILHEENRGVAANLKAYLPAILDGKLGLTHMFTYEQHEIVEYVTIGIETDEIQSAYPSAAHAD